MPRSRLVLRLRTVMPRTEVLTPTGIRLLDRHIRIAEANDDNLVRRILNVHRALLPLTRRVEGLVQRHLLALIGITFLGEGGFHSPDMTFLTVRFRMIIGISLLSILVSALVS